MPSISIIFKNQIAVLSYLSRGGTRFRLNGNLIRIGKDPKSEVPVKGFGIGKTAAIITKLSDGWYIGGAGGFFKPKLNDATLEKSVKLKHFDILKLYLTIVTLRSLRNKF